MKFPLYNLWMDNMFYAYLGVLAASVFTLVYALRRLFRGHEDCEPLPPEEPAAAPGEPVEIIEELPLPATADADSAMAAENAQEPAGKREPQADPEKTVVVENIGELVAEQAGREAQGIAVEELISLAENEAAAGDEPAAAPPPPRTAPAEAPPSTEPPGTPEELVRGIYSRLSGMDARIGAIEEHLRTGAGRHFATKFLEGLLDDFDALSEPKIKARVEYLLSDLKEARDRGEKAQGS